MKEVIASLENIEKVARRGDAAQVQQAIRSARKSLTGAKDDKLKQLDEELSTWQKKSDVILKETVGREGMAKHAKHWAEELRKLSV